VLYKLYNFRLYNYLEYNKYMNNKFTKISILSVVTLLPSFAFAACTTSPGTLQNIACQLTDIAASYIVPLLTIGAFVFFLWRVLKFIQDPGNSMKKNENRQAMMWSIVGLVVMVSIWGIVAVVGNTLGIDSGFVPQVKPPLTKSGWKGYTGSGTNTSGGSNTTTGQNGSNNTTTGQNGSGTATGQNGSNSATGQNSSGQ